MLKYSLENPVKILVGVLFILLFGLQALINMSYQLRPDVEYPTITVRTSWSGATPYEIEQEIVEPQENVLKSLAGLVEMESVSNNGSGSITLRFELGTNLMDAILLVSNKLNEVRRYPTNSDRPTIRASGADAAPIVYMLIEPLPDNKKDIDSYQTYINDEIVPRFERIDGISEVFFYGGRPTQMQVTIKPEKMAAYNISIEKLTTVIMQNNTNTSAGLLPVGRKNYRVRTVSEFTSPDDIKETLVVSEHGGVKVKDIADVGYGYAASDSAVKYGDKRMMLMGIVNEGGSNVLKITDAVEALHNELNKNVLAAQGLQLHWVYDQRPYINGAIGLVQGNIVFGGILAIISLLLFLRKGASTIIIAIAIPISIIGTFIVLNLLGRTLNVICLAGIAFAVGMLIDNAIVVLENIDRHLNMDKKPLQAAIDGASEVWGAVLSSTLTTVSVFLPIVFVKQEAGQLFRDIAIAISSAVSFSLLVAVFVTPVLTRLIFEKFPPRAPSKLSIKIGDFGTKLTDVIMSALIFINVSLRRRLTLIIGFMSGSLLLTLLLYPKMEYLPQGNMNMIQTSLIVPSGLSLNERGELADMLYKEVRPYTESALDGYPRIKDYIYFINPGGVFIQTTSADPNKADRLVPLMASKTPLIPGVMGFTAQQGVFQNRGSGTRSMNVVVSGENIDELIIVSRQIMARILELIPKAQIRPRPSLEMMFPEANFIPSRYRLADAGLNPSTLGTTIDVYVDGRRIGDFHDPAIGTMDLTLNYPANDIANPEDLSRMPLATSNGGVIPIYNVADLELSAGMEGIRRYERKRTFNLTIIPPPDVVLEQMMDIIDGQVIAPLRADGALRNVETRFTGSASSLNEAKDALARNFVLAIIITYLLMAALFDNFFYPLIILFSVPFALAGGFLGFRLVDKVIVPQSFDILTMLGFIILIGIVVNNAILIVHQSLNNIRLYRMPAQSAITESVSSRLRPIFMSSLSTILGLLPLVVFSGPGSELYRGLGSVMLGGLALSTVITIFVVPAMLSLCMGFLESPQRKR
ncbi:efflux RND transporter permease subunit [Deferribacterales bacterium RsTz2092]|nr:acriflavin resistance protein [Deferribacterales bacterium]